jgi:tetratricopeptide (TPR) repeat protein
MYNDDETRKSDEVYMRQLYDRFRQEVESGATIDYYEINELLDIYDFAQDEGDAMVQMYVFLTVARLYPGNKEFDERIAFFLSYYSQQAASDMIARQGRRDSALWDILMMGVKCYQSQDPVPYLEDILKKYDVLDCESILKLIDLLRDMDHCELLVLYYPQLKARAEDPRGLAFEIAEIIQYEEGMQEDARDIADELTKLEPFNCDAWLLLSRIEYGLEHIDDALAAVDYALAIDPTHFNARVTKGIIMSVMPDRVDDSIALLKEILEEDPLNGFALEGLSEAYSRSHRRKEACEIYAFIIKNKITTSTTIDPLLSIVELEPDNLEDYLQLYFDIVSNEEDWKLKAEYLILKGKPVLAANLLDFYHRKAGIKQYVDFYLHVLYDAQMLERFSQVFEEVAVDLTHPASAQGFFAMSDYLMLAAVYLRLGRKDEAAQLSLAIAQTKEQPGSLDQQFMSRGIRLTASFIHSIATSEDLTVDLRNLDPLRVDFMP